MLTVHGLSGTTTHRAWVAMLARCRNPRNKRYDCYGGRGIKVCDQWLKYENFFSDMGERPAGLTLDRINVDGNYEPTNCRWTTNEVQNYNKTNTRFVTIGGERLTLNDAMAATGLSYGGVYSRSLREAGVPRRKYS